MKLVRTVLSIAVVASAALPLLPQTSAPPRPSFEVAAIKPYADPGSGPRFFGFRGAPGDTHIAMTGVTAKMLLTYAYRVRDFQIIGGPDWINTERYDIQAKAEDGSLPPPTIPADPEAVGPMQIRTQSLLDDRFQLKMHRETRDLPVYELVEGKNGPRLAPSEDQSPPQIRKPGDPPPPPPQRGGPPNRGGIGIQRTPDGFTLQASGIPLPTLLAALSSQVGRPIVNKTNLPPGLYDIKLQWSDSGPSASPLPPSPGAESRPAAEDPSGPSVFTAIQEQLGLRLVSSRGPVEVLVIDSVQKPTSN